MKIIATVTELDVEAWNAKGPPYRTAVPDHRFAAVWHNPVGGNIHGNHSASKEEALASLREHVLKFLASMTTKSIEQVEIDL